MLRLLVTLTLWLLLITNQVVCFLPQSVWVKGRLMCGSDPAKGVLVKLIDADNGPNPDDLLDSAYTDTDGYYNLKGDSSEWTNIDPELRIYHDCMDFGKPCQRKWVIRIPDKYIFDGTEPGKAMNLGTMNLEVELEDEDQDCDRQPHNLCFQGSDPDDELDVGFTDENGNFDLSGGTAEMTTIDPHLKVYHDCNDGKTPCQRRWKFELPNHYIQLPTHRHHHHQQQQQQPPQYSSHEVHLKRKTLNIGVWNLEAILPAESHDCIH
ncbi:unnamed protein product [Anisakis simplex]|uniref:Transthyretin-like family protein n=1 Tax=Anisakis simplex TaxID=6269 RepID=A0A0M3K304_ANISI|nr:unnamed protein product [Anisakis simplex]